MASISFSKILRTETDAIWHKILNHPFVEGIGSGKLDSDRYGFYLKQDYLYLIEFSRVLAIASAKAITYNEMGYFAYLLNLTLNTEMELHRRTCDSLGITAQKLQETEPALITTAYTNFMIKTCYEGTITEILTVLLPCAVGYVEIATHLKAKGLPNNTYYKDWIETYSSKDFVEYSEWLGSKLDHFGDRAREDEIRFWKNLYHSSCRFELLFFEMSWNRELWPDVSI